MNGLHCHALMPMLTYAFLQHRPLAEAGREKNVKAGLPPPQPTLPAMRRAILNCLERGSIRSPHCDPLRYRASSS